MITVEARLNLSLEDEQTLKELMCRYSACYHTIYNLICDEKESDEHELRRKFNISSRYFDAASCEAESLYKAQIELEKDPKKVIFGSKKLFRKLKKRHLSLEQRKKLKEKYRETRKYNLFSIAEKSRKGNNNTQIQGTKLRITVGNKQWIYADIVTKHKKWQKLLNSGKYTVKITIRDNICHAYFSFEEPLPVPTVDFKNGAIGIDLNASSANIAWAETNFEGNYINSDTIGTPELYDCRANKRDWFVWSYAQKIVQIALDKGKGIVIEDLHTGGPNRVTSNFCRGKLRDAITATAKRAGVQVIAVPAYYTSIIGCVKYAPLYNLSRHEAAALVIARRGQGFKEKVPQAYKYKEIFKEVSKISTCKVNVAGVPQKKKKARKKSLRNEQFRLVYRVCRKAVLTEQFTGPIRKTIPNWSMLRKYLLTGQDSRLKKLVPSSRGWGGL